MVIVKLCDQDDNIIKTCFEFFNITHWHKYKVKKLIWNNFKSLTDLVKHRPSVIHSLLLQQNWLLKWRAGKRVRKQVVWAGIVSKIGSTGFEGIIVQWRKWLTVRQYTSESKKNQTDRQWIQRNMVHCMANTFNFFLNLKRSKLTDTVTLLFIIIIDCHWINQLIDLLQFSLSLGLSRSPVSSCLPVCIPHTLKVSRASHALKPDDCCSPNQKPLLREVISEVGRVKIPEHSF